MAAVKYVSKKDLVHLTYAPRQAEIKPIIADEQFYPITNTNVPTFEAINMKTKNSIIPASKTNKLSLSTDNNLNNLPQIKQNGHGFSGWFQRLTLKQKTIFKIVFAIIIFVGIASAAALPLVVLLVIPRTNLSSSITNNTVLICSSTTCIGKETPYHTSIVTVRYPFDGNATDTSGSVTGITYASPTYIPQAYVGSRALLLNNPGSNQYIEIPYVNLAQRSFTIETWLYLINTSVLNDYGIFSQCDINLICLSISLRNGRFTLAFDSVNAANNTLIGGTVAATKEWIHLTVEYDAVLYQQQIYVNGRIDAVSSGIDSSYKGTSVNSTTTIGRSRSFGYGLTYFHFHPYYFRIDHFTISAGVTRTACQINNDATLMVYYPFDSVATYDDYSVNLYNVITSNTNLISYGRVGQAIYFSTNTSYLQVQGFPTIRNTSGVNPPFTFSLWLNPATSSGGGSVIHISNLAAGNGSICYDLLAFTVNGALVVQLMGQTSTVMGLLGLVLPINTWTHVAVVYSRGNGVRLLINGQLTVAPLITDIPQNITRWDTPLYITLGNNNPLGSTTGPNCPISSIPFISGSYRGAIDDFRFYNRELDTQELCVLTNI